MRYKFYREHKFVSAALNDVERIAAKIDFRSPEETQRLALELERLISMLKGHAAYENDKLHGLLKGKNNQVLAEIEKDHEEQELDFKHLKKLLDKAIQAQSEEEQIEGGYQFYLYYRKFVADNLAHLYQEETTILPELQRLYSDEELKKVEAKTYHEMTVDHLVGMIEVLFPHMNTHDRKAFLQDIKDAEPDKYKLTLQNIGPSIDTKDIPV